MLIKESFETIKKWHGKAIKIDFEGSTQRPTSGFRSERPNAEQYTEDFENDRYWRDNNDYKEWASKAGQSTEHQHFSSIKSGIQ
jgi:hypothetical protein